MHGYDSYFGLLAGMFWGLFILALIIVPVVLRYQARIKAMETARRLLEGGVTPPPEMLAAMKAWAPRDHRPRPPEQDLRFGVVLVAASGALLVLGAVVQSHHSEAGVHPLFGVAAFPGLIGLALICLWFFDPRRRRP